jgi:aminopeptidase N
LRLSQERYRPIGAELPAQTWSVPVAAAYGAGDRSASLRVVLDQPSETVELEFCPQWISGNAEGVGYYIASYGDRLAPLAERVDALPVGEQISLLSDASMLVAAGQLEPPAALELLPRFAGSPHRQVVSSAATIARSVDDHLVADELRPNYARFIAAVFGARAQEIGWEPAPEEAEDVALLRTTMLELLGDQGESAEVRAEARRRVDRWFEDPTALDPSLRSTALELAALGGDAALFDRILARAKATEDRRERGDLLRALGSFRDPALVERSLGLLLADDFDLREVAGLTRGFAGDRRTRDRLFTWIRDNWDSYAPRIPEQWRSGLTFAVAGLCDEASRKQVEEFFGPRLAGVAQGPIRLEQTLDGIELCIARKAAQQSEVSEFLKAY